MSKDNLSSLYSGLIKKGYSVKDIGDEATFRTKMADKNNRKQLYDYVSSRGDFRIGDYDSYEKRLTSVQEEQPQQTEQPQQQTEIPAVVNTAQVQAPELPAADTVQQQAEKPLPKARRQSLREQVGGGMAIAVPDEVEMAAKFADSPQIYDPNANIQRALAEGKLDTIVNEDEEKRISAEFKPKPVVNPADIYENYSNRFSLTERGKQLSSELSGISQEIQNRYANEFLSSDEFKNLQKQYKGEELGKKANEAFSRLYSGKIDNELQPYVKAYLNEAYSRYGQNIEDDVAAYNEDLRRKTKDQIASDVSSLDKSVNAQLEENHRKLTARAGTGGSAFNALMGSASYNAGSAQDRKAKAELEAARQLVDESNNIISEARKKGKTNFVAGLGRGLSDAVFDANTWSFGLQDMRDASVLVDALDKFDRGETLTESEQTLMDAAVANMAVNAYYYSDLGRGYKAGTVSGQSIPFMLEFAINPVSASGSAIAKNILKYGMKKFGKSAVKNNAAKFAARLVGDAAAAAAMTGTSSAARVAAGTMERAGGDIQLDESGTGYAGRTGQMGTGEALGKSFASTFLENQSEMVFNAFSGLGSKIWKTAEKYVPGGTAAIMDNAIMGKAGEIYRKIKSNPTLKEVARRTQFHGIGEEYLEEVYNNFANIPLGEMTLEEATDLDNNIDTFLGLAPTSVAFGIIGLGGLAAQKAEHRKKLKAAFGNMTRIEKNRLAKLEELAEKGGNEDIKAFIRETMLDTSLTPEEKKAEIEYAYNLAVGNAIDDVEAAQQEEVAVNNAAASEEGAAIYAEHNPETMRQTVLRREVAEQRLVDAGFSIDKLKATPVNERQELLSRIDEENTQLVVDFFDAFDREEAMNEALDTAHEEEVSQARSMLQDIVLPNQTVTVVPLGQYGTEQAQYGVVVSGIDAQGNPTQSNGAVVTYPVQIVNGTPDFSTIDKGNPIVTIPKSYTDAMVFSPDEAFNGMLTAYQQDAAILEGTPIVPGAQFPVMLDDGSMQNVTVAGTAPTGESVVVLPDGKTASMSAEELSTRKRNAELAPIMAEQAEEEQIQQQAVQEAATAGYSDEVRNLQPQAGEKLVVNGRNAAIKEVAPDGIIVDYLSEGGDITGTDIVPLETYYDYKQSQFNQQNNVQAQSDKDTADSVQESPVEGDTADRSGDTTADRSGDTTATEEVQQTEETDYPVDEAGEPAFLRMQPQRTVQLLTDTFAEDAASFVSDRLSAAQKAAEKAAKKSPKALGFNERAKELAQIRQEREDAAREVEYWQNISSLMAPEVQPQQVEEKPKAQTQASAPNFIDEAEEANRKNQERLAAMTEEEIAAAQAKVQENIDKGKYDRKPASRRRSRYNDEDVAMGEAYTPMEHVLREIATGRITFQWSDKGATQGLGSHLGLSGSIKDRQKLIWALSSEGYPPKVASEIIHADMPAAMQEIVDQIDVFNMILEAFQQYGSPSRMFEAAQQLHGIDIESQPGYEEDMERQELEWHAEHNKMSVDEWTTYLDVVEEEMEKLYNSMSDEEINAIFEEIYNEIYYGNRRTENESTGSVEAAGNTETGNEVQPGERTDNETADGRSQTEPSKTNQTDEQGSGILPEQEIESLNEGSDISPAQESIRKAEEDVNTNPTEAQKEAGNYKKGHVRIDGMDITIENPKGSTRSGVDANGKQWSVTMNNTYGYIRGTRGVDGDHIDIFLSDNPESGNVYVVDQIRQDTGEFDESKVLYGFNSMEEARQAYLSNYEKDWKVGIITEVTKEEFKKWIDSSWNKVKPFSEYVNVKKLEISDDGNAADINQEPHDILMSIYSSELSKEREKLKDIKKQIAEEQKKEEPDNETLERLNEEKDITEHSIKKIKSFTDKKTSVMSEENFLLTEIIKEKSLTYNSEMSINDIMNSVDEDAINDIIDKYPDYIYELSKNGTLQKEFDESGVNDEIIIRNAIESSGYEIDDLINTSEKKDLTKKKKENERNRKSKELMEKLGINSTDIRFREGDTGYSEFAQKYNLNEADIRKYAQSIKANNLGGASYAFKSIKRNVLLQNPGLSLGQFVKVFSPIKEELYNVFGNLDSLRNEYIQNEIEERNIMEAARKRAEDEAEAERIRLFEFEQMTDEEMDNAYFKAVEANDERRMRDIINESARRNGYISTDEFKMSHRAPSFDDEGYNKSMVDVANNKDDIRDSLNEQMRMNRDKNREESATAINKALSDIEKEGKATVTIYRAVPKSIKERNVRNGDWVTFSESYAKQHGNHALEGNYRIIKEDVPAENLYWDGNDINEWGYDDRSDYRYKNTKNNRKLNDLITRDDKGNIIPPSQRFNSRKSDIRFRTSENLITEISDEMQGLIKDTPLSSNPAYNINNIGTAFYERSGYYMRRLPSPAERKVLKEGNIDIEHAKDVYDKVLPVYTELKHELINMIPDATMAARKEIAAYVEAINNNIEYYKGLSEGKDVWRTRPLYRFEEEYGLTEEVAMEDIERFDKMVPNHPEIHIAYTEEDLMSLKEAGIDEKEIQDIKENALYNPNVGGVFMSKSNMILMFPSKAIDERSFEACLWHENTHYVLHNSKSMDYETLTDDCLMYLKDKYSENYNIIIKGYPKEHWNEEGVTFLMQNLVDENGAEKIINAKFEGNDNISRLFTTILNEFKDETKRRGTVRNKLRHVQAEASDGKREENNGNDDGRRSGKPEIEQEVERRGENESERTRQERIKSFITEQAAKLNIPVTVYTSLEEVPEGKARKAIEKAEQTGRYPKGWYIPGTDMVYIYLPASTGISDTMATILHEGVAHYGLRKMVGEENLNKFLNDVYSQASPEIRKKILEILNKLNESMPQLQHTLGEATEEYIASLAENGIINPTFWDKVKQLFKKMLESIGYRWKITDNDIRYILWESKNNLRKSRNPLDVAKETVMRNRLDIGEYGTQPSEDTRFRFEERPPLVQEYDTIIKSKSFQFMEAFVTDFYAVDVVQDIIEKESGKPIRTFENASTAHNRLSSVNKEDHSRFIKDFYKPLIDHINLLIKKSDREKTEDYIYAKSGLARNKKFLQRDADRMFEDSKKELDEKLQNNEITQKQYDALMKLEKERFDKFISEGGDYSGLTGLVIQAHQEELDKIEDKNERKNKEKEIGKNYKEHAEKVVTDFESIIPSDEIEKLWKLIKAATDEILRIQYESGMISREKYEELKNYMEYYVPLKGWKENVAEDYYDYTRTESPVQKEKKAKGRWSLADNPIASIALSAQNAIILGNRNKMKQRFFNFIVNRPNELITIRDVWYEKTNNCVFNQREPVYPDIKETDDAETVQQKLEIFEKNMQEKEKQGLAHRGRLPLGLELNFKGKQKQEHIISVMINGKEYVMYVNGSPRVAQAINGLTNREGGETNFIKDAYFKAKRAYGAGLTSYNINFVPANFVRDFLHSSLMTYLEKGFIPAAKFVLNTRKSAWYVGRGILGMYNPDSKNDKYFQEFIRNGGETGYTAVHTLEDYKKEYEKAVNELKGLGKVASFGKKSLEGIKKALELVNRIAEDTNRFNAYMSSRQSGLTIEESIDAAKNITVNFNRKGAGSKTKGPIGALAGFMNAWVLFFNPSVQGIYQIGKTAVKNKKRVLTTMATTMAAGFFTPYLNEWLISVFGGDDKDDYFYQNDYTRMNNWMIYLGVYIKVPLPPFFREIYGMGDIFYRLMTNRITPERAAYLTARQIQSALGVINLLPEDKPSIKEFFGSLVPDLGSPLVDIMLNRDFTGRPIAKDYDWNKYLPEYERVYKGVNPGYIEFSRLLNDMLGGDDARKAEWLGDYINPAYMEHLVTQYTGGIGKTISDLSGIAADIATGNSDNIEARKIPIVSRFVSPTTEQSIASAVNRVFYDYLDRYEALKVAEKRYKEFLKDGRTEYRDELQQMKDNGEVEFIRYFDMKMKTVRKLQNILKNNPDNKKVEQRIIELKSEMCLKAKEKLEGTTR